MLTQNDIDLLLEAMRHAKQAFERYTYPTPTLRERRITDADAIIDKLRAIRRDLRAKKEEE